MTLQARIEELVSRTYPGGGTQVTNCLAHMHRDRTDRPTECALCSADTQNYLRRAIAVNVWLNTYKDDAERVLREVLLKESR